jgi:hypothetical protein
MLSVRGGVSKIMKNPPGEEPGLCMAVIFENEKKFLLLRE